MSAEQDRLNEENRDDAGWKKWGPCLSERQWGTVREDYSENGVCSMNIFTAITAPAVGASHQTGWTGVVAKLIELFGILDSKTLLDLGKESFFGRER